MNKKEVQKIIQEIILSGHAALDEYEWDFTESIEIARTILLKQIPTKPMHGFNELLVPSYYGCSRCHRAMMKKDFDGIRFNYCPYCGQAINWSDEDD